MEGITNNNLVEVKLVDSPSWRKTYTSKEILESFLDWLIHECDGSEPTESLFDEFLYLEVYVRPTLIRKVDSYVV